VTETHSERRALELVLGRDAARLVTRAPGGWRTLSARELEALGLSAKVQDKVLALQELILRGYPELSEHRFVCSDDVGRVYGERLGALDHEVVLALAVDGLNRLIQEFEVASGGRHGAAVSPADVFRPLIRAGASAFLLVHNHPASGDPTPSREDIVMTKALSAAGALVGIPLLDHVVIGGRGGGFTSLVHIISENIHESRSAHAAVSA
jgi:DNA repair protein RadC